MYSQLDVYVSSLRSDLVADAVGARVAHITVSAVHDESLELSDRITGVLVDIATLCDMLLITAAPP